MLELFLGWVQWLYGASLVIAVRLPGLQTFFLYTDKNLQHRRIQRISPHSGLITDLLCTVCNWINNKKRAFLSTCNIYWWMNAYQLQNVLIFWHHAKFQWGIAAWTKCGVDQREWILRERKRETFIAQGSNCRKPWHISREHILLVKSNLYSWRVYECYMHACQR